jgi:hypothetical protein
MRWPWHSVFVSRISKQCGHKYRVIRSSISRFSLPPADHLDIIVPRPADFRFYVNYPPAAAISRTARESHQVDPERLAEL